jgi:hypothetical protein
LNARNGARCVRVRASNIAAADETDVGCHSPLISGMGYSIQEAVMKCIQSQELRLVPGGGVYFLAAQFFQYYAEICPRQ